MAPAEERWALVDREDLTLSVARQCSLLGLNRTHFYYPSAADDPSDVVLKHRLDELYTESPFYGSRRMTAQLCREGHVVNRKRIVRLMREMGIVALYPKPNLSASTPSHKKYPYLLRDYTISRPNEVWSSDITYIRLNEGFVYLVAVLDWYSRYVLSWELSNTLDGAFCIDALKSAFRHGKPSIFNTDQGVQYTAIRFQEVLESEGIRSSMDGRGRAFDNIFIERLWRTVKYEDIYVKDYASMPAVRAGLKEYFTFYNTKRLHQSLQYATPKEVHFAN